MTVTETIRSKLAEAIDPDELEIIDQSYLHKGHAGAPEGGESHFKIRVVAAAFSGLSRVERQRMINAILAEELAGPVHALTMELATPE